MRQALIVIVFVLVCAHIIQGKPEKPECPIGFRLVHRTEEGWVYGVSVENPVCLRVKEPEVFADKFVDCTGNLYSSELFENLDMMTPVETYWSDYKSLYPGGLTVDWSYTESMGNLPNLTQITNLDSLGINKEYCLVITPTTNLTAVSCDEKYHRFCVVKPYVSRSHMSSDECEKLDDSWRFTSPTKTCVAAVSGVSGGTITATWKQAKKKCHSKNASLLSRGWRYSNSPLLRSSNSSKYPFGVIYNKEHSILWFDTEVENVEIPESQWNFKYKNFSSGAMLGAVDENFWYLVDDSYVFNDVIVCEKTIQLKNVTLDINIDSKNKIILSSSEKVDETQIYCFTDSKKYYPERVESVYDDISKTFAVEIIKDGYYWCVNVDSLNCNVAESKKILFIREKLSLMNIYAVKIKQINKYKITILKAFEKLWKEKLKKYIFYGTRYVTKHGKNGTADSKINEDILKKFISSDPDLKVKDSAIINIKTKRLYLDEKSALVHIGLNSEMEQVPPGTWNGIEIISMKPVYYCKGVNFVPTLSLGETTTIADCRTYTCTGDFNEGVEWTVTSTKDCIHTTTINSATDTTSDDAMFSEETPEDESHEVIKQLKGLLNDTATITVADISSTFEEVDYFLSESNHVPGLLLHLLDEIGARLNITGPEDVAKSVWDNIALVVVDTQPEKSVRGFRILTTDSNKFTESAFQILGENANFSDASSRHNDLLVQFPPSVALSNRRISFMAFRADRAFQSNKSDNIVNSYVLSINVNGLKKIPTGEVIDIHFNPFQDPNDNFRRVCAFWKFLEDETGYWSDEGCKFIPATEVGMLDTCRCDHLTHFAEILMPRTSFTDGHENALQLISVTGCCLSIVGLLLIGFTAILFRSWQRDFTNKIWFQLCVANLILVICFLTVVYAGFPENSFGCMFLGVFVHYSTLASFCWMLVAAVVSYTRLVIVFSRDTSHKLLKAAVFSWGAPLTIVAILLSVDSQSYARKSIESQKIGAFCYPSGLSLWLSVYTPIVIMLLANWTIFILIVRSVFATNKIKKHGDSKEALRCASVSCLLVFLFGLPWVFGLFRENLATVYLFVLTANFQGFVLFIFFILGNKKTRELWLIKLKIKPARKVPVFSSSYTNRSCVNTR